MQLDYAGEVEGHEQQGNRRGSTPQRVAAYLPNPVARGVADLCSGGATRLAAGRQREAEVTGDGVGERLVTVLLTLAVPEAADPEDDADSRPGRVSSSDLSWQSSAQARAHRLRRPSADTHTSAGYPTLGTGWPRLLWEQTFEHMRY